MGWWPLSSFFNNLFGVIQDIGNQDDYLRVIEVVDDDFALTVLLDQIILTQKLELVRHPRLLPIKSFADFRNTHGMLN